MAQDTKTEKKQNKRSIKRDYFYAVGKRREASARVRLYPTVKEGLMWKEQAVRKDQILVNQMPIEHYFPGPIAKTRYMEPFYVTNTINRYALTIQVEGGGRKGQLDALIIGIARVLSLADEEKHRPALKAKGFLTRDARIRERRKVGKAGKARRKKSSPKR